MMKFIDICMGIRDDCQNLGESYGVICVRCNKCGRFDKEEQVAIEKCEAESEDEK